MQEKLDWVTGPISTELLRDKQLLELDVSNLDLPKPVLLGLSVSRCLDELPLGLFLLVLRQLLGQALKEQVLVILV